MASFATNQNHISSEKFIIKYTKTARFESKYLDFSLRPEEIKMVILKNPEFIDNIDYAINFLLRYQEKINSFSSTFTDSKLSFVSFQKYLTKFNILAKTRINSKNDPIENDFSIKKIEDNQYYFPESIINSYSTLIMISRSCYNMNDKNNSINQLINLYRSYSIQSNFTPINPKLIKRTNDEMNDFNPLFIGIPTGSPIIHRNGIASNGNFRFVLHSDMHLSIFPICNENGGFLSPFMCKLILNPSSKSVSLSFSSNDLIVSANNFNSIFNFSSIIKGQSETEFFEVKPKTEIIKKDFQFVISDGFVNIYIGLSNDLMTASVKLIDSQKEINQVVLKQNKNKDLYANYPFDNSLLKWPVETNGLVLSFYIKINNNRILCRQFSLINGIHLKDEIIETNINLLSITYDSINKMHYAAIDNNGQLIIHALSSSSNCSLNPFIFGFSIPGFSGSKNIKAKLISLLTPVLKLGQKNENEFKNEKEFIHLFSSILLTSIFFKKDINTFIINESENILLLPLFLIEIARIMHSNNNDKENLIYNIQLASIQVLSILFVINVRHQYSFDNQKSRLCIKIESVIFDLLIEISEINESFLMNIISFIVLNLFDLINFFENDVQSILHNLIINSSSVLLNYIIHVFYMNSDKLSALTFKNDENVFIKYIINNYPLIKCHPNIISFLLCHQRCIINQVHLSINKNQTSTYSIIINIKYDDCKTDNDALNNFSEYSNFLVNQLTTSFACFSSFEEIQKTTVYFLFTNFLSLITGLYEYNEVAQIVTHLLYITQCSIKELFERKSYNLLKNGEMQNLLLNISLAFGAFTGTMIKGGNYPDFDEKYKWLIRPNMNLISDPILLKELENPITNVMSFIDPNVRSFFSPSSSLNGSVILQDIYKKWNPNMNKNLRSPFLELDQLFFAVELYHLQLFEELKEKNIEKLRPALNQMMTVRNKARAILQSSNETRQIPILDLMNNNNDNSDYNQAIDYSPFDLIVIKCKMLLRMKSKFDDSNISIAPKLLADFVLSPVKPSVFINYISNQNKRLDLTNIGFSLIEESYSLKIDESFVQIINTVLSIVVDDFDGLSSIIQYDSSHESEKYIYNFILKALSNIESPYLALIVYKLIKSEVLPNELIGKLIEKNLSSAITNNKLFGICYRRFGCISNLFSGSESFLFDDPESGKKVSLMSLPEKEFNKINEKQWIIISDALFIQKCDPILYKKILNFFINSDFHNNLFILRFVSRCIYSFYEKYDDGSYPLKNVKNDFHLLLSSLAKSLDKNSNIERASEIITFFRKILVLSNELTLTLIEIFKSYETLYNQNKHVNVFDFKEKICAIFAILGGFIDIIKIDNPVSFRIDREKYEKGIFFFDKNTIIKYPLDEETRPINVSDVDLSPEPLIPFNWCMYPNFDFITLFMYYATEELTSQICLTYLNSLFYYLKEESFYDSLTDEHIEYLIERFSSFMNPFDNIKDYQIIISYLLTHKKAQPLQSCHFSMMSNNWCKSYLSPIVRKLKMKVSVQFNQEFDGYFGLIADCPLEKQFPYAIIESKIGTIYPGFIGARSKKIGKIEGTLLHFSIDVAEQKIILNEDSNSNKIIIQIPQIAHQTFEYRIFICVIKPCKVDSIKVKSFDSNQWNSLDLY